MESADRFQRVVHVEDNNNNNNDNNNNNKMALGLPLLFYGKVKSGHIWRFNGKSVNIIDFCFREYCSL